MLMRWDPFNHFSRLDSELDRIWSLATPNGVRRVFEPAVDVVEYEDAIELMVEVPGMKADEISVQVENDTLVLSGERKPVHREGAKVRRGERAHGTFRRTFVLSKEVDRSEIDASLKDGVLTLRLAKRAPEARRIEVKIPS